jgi:hypothetical protein
VIVNTIWTGRRVPAAAWLASEVLHTPVGVEPAACRTGHDAVAATRRRTAPVIRCSLPVLLGVGLRLLLARGCQAGGSQLSPGARADGPGEWCSCIGGTP